MDITEVRKTLCHGHKEELEMMARAILTHGRSHQYMKDLSRYANEFNDLMSRLNGEDKDYLALVYLLAEHLNEIKSGSCACSIVQKPMYNSPERLGGILEILDETLIIKDYSVCIHSRCLACGKEYESRMVDSGFGQKVNWNVRS